MRHTIGSSVSVTKWIKRMPTEISNSGSQQNLTLSEGDSPQVTLTEETPKTALGPEILEQWAQTRLAHEGMMLEKIMRQNRIVENSVRGLQKDAGYETEIADKGEEGEDDAVGVSIGNRTTHVYHAPKPDEPPAKTGMGLKTAAVLGAGLLLGPAGAVGLNYVLNQRDGIVDTDTDTKTDVTPGFGVPEKVERANEFHTHQ